MGLWNSATRMQLPLFVRMHVPTVPVALVKVFHGITLSKWRALSAMDLWYYSLYMLGGCC